MDNKHHIKKLIEGMMENHDILMCGLFQEKSGSSLLKIRFNDLPGGGTRNSNIHFRRKSDKQFDRDITRPSSSKQNTKDLNPPSSRTRSKTENMRCDNLSYEHVHGSLFDGVASPESCIGSDATFKSPEVQCYSPGPLMYAEQNTQITRHTDSHRVDPISEARRAYHWVDSIPEQNVNLISLEDCSEFQSDIEIVNGCLSSDVEPISLTFCETSTQPISMSAPLEYHEADSIPCHDSLMDNESARAQGNEAVGAVLGSKFLAAWNAPLPPVIPGSKMDALVKLIRKGLWDDPESTSHSTITVTSDEHEHIEETPAEPRRKPKKKRKKKSRSDR